MTRMLVTRPEPDASETAARLRALAIEAVTLPLLTRAPLSPSLPDAKGFAGMALTSANALHALAERGATLPSHKFVKYLFFLTSTRLTTKATRRPFGDMRGSMTVRIFKTSSALTGFDILNPP